MSTGVPIALLAIIGVLVVCYKRKAARATIVRGAEMRTVDVASAATYDMRLNEAFLSATQPSSQVPIAPHAPLAAINTVPVTTCVFGADGKPIINTIPATAINTVPVTTCVFGADGKPITNTIPATAINIVPVVHPATAIATTSVFADD